MFNGLKRTLLIAALATSPLLQAEEVKPGILLEKLSVFQLTKDNLAEIEAARALQMEFAEALKDYYQSNEGKMVRAEAILYNAVEDKTWWSADRDLRAAVAPMIRAASKATLIGSYHERCSYKGFGPEIDHCWDNSNLIDAFEPWESGSQEIYIYPAGRIVMPVWFWEGPRRAEPLGALNLQMGIDHGYARGDRNPLEITLFSSGGLRDKTAVNLRGLSEAAKIDFEFTTTEIVFNLLTGEITERPSTGSSCSYEIYMGKTHLGCARSLINGTYTNMYRDRPTMTLSPSSLTDEEELQLLRTLIN